jgi:hypothetical protein
LWKLNRRWRKDRFAFGCPFVIGVHMGMSFSF